MHELNKYVLLITETRSFVVNSEQSPKNYLMWVVIQPHVVGTIQEMDLESLRTEL